MKIRLAEIHRKAFEEWWDNDPDAQLYTTYLVSQAAWKTASREAWIEGYCCATDCSWDSAELRYNGWIANQGSL